MHPPLRRLFPLLLCGLVFALALLLLLLERTAAPTTTSARDSVAPPPVAASPGAPAHSNSNGKAEDAAADSALAARVPDAVYGTSDPMQPASPLAAQLRRSLELSRGQPVLNPDGSVTRARIVRDDQFKYPLLRVEETFRPRLHHPGSFDQRPVKTILSVADHVLVTPARQLDDAEARQLAADLGATLRRRSSQTGLLLLALPAAGSNPRTDHLPAAVTGFSAHPLVRVAEPDYVVHASLVATDPEFARLYAIQNTGQSVNGAAGTADADMDVAEAWDATTGSSSVRIGVIDSGVDWKHPDLAGQIAINTGEIPGNRIDDDGNGYVDDVRGWDFYANDNDPADEHHHGTHVAGTIGARANNGIGIAGVMWQVGIVPLRFIGADGNGVNSDAVDAIAYATQLGIRITNNSWGGGEFSQALKDVIDAAGAANSVFVAAAGNDASSTPMYPAAYDSANILSVAATNSSDALASFSNYGSDWVDVAAPGVNIYSLDIGTGYQFLNGTSMATPNVAGVCGLIRSIFPDLSASAVIQWITSTVDLKSALTGRVATGGRVNANNAIVNNLTIPWPILDQTIVTDSGNANGVINPGENVTLTLAVRNVSPVAASGVSATLSLITADPHVTITSGSASLGSLAHLETKNAVFTFQIAPDVPTPRELALVLTTTDSANRTRVIPVSLRAYTQVLVTGTVRAVDGSPLPGATIAYSGPFYGSTETDSNGAYSLLLVDGAHELTASMPGHTTTGPRVVTTPPACAGVDFVLPSPRLTTSLTALSATVGPDGRTTLSVPLANPGDSPATYTVRPMQYGYAKNGEPGGVPFSWVDISATGTLVNTAQLAFNGYSTFNSGPYPIGMDFPFYEGSFRSFRLNNEGWISFTNPTRVTTLLIGELPDPDKPENLIAFAWVSNMDWGTLYQTYPAGSRRLYYQQVDPQTFVATQQQWALIEGDLLTSQVILKRDGSIILQYGAFTGWDGTNATRSFPSPNVYIAGMQDATGVRGQTPVYGPLRIIPSQGTSIRMYPVVGAPWLRASAAAGSLPANGGQASLEVTLDAAGLAPGIYTTKLVLDSNDAGTPAIEIPVTLTVAAGESALAWVSPAAEAVVNPGSSLTLEVQASGDMAGLQSVDFYAGDTLLGTGTASGSTYTCVWANPSNGAHDLRAVASFADSRILSTPVRTVSVGSGFRVRIDSLDYSNTTPAVGRHRAIVEPFGIPRVNFNAVAQSPYARRGSITRNGQVATLTVPSTHRFKTGMGATDTAFISGADQPEYNGLKTITYVDATTYTFPVSGNPATPATGTISVSDAGSAVIEENGYALHMGGEISRKFAYPYTVTANTVLEFDFLGQTLLDLGNGVVGIGLDSDDVLSKNRIFHLWGMANWGAITTYRNYVEEVTDSTPSRWRHYRIPVGQHFTGAMTHLTFVQVPSEWWYGRDGDISFRNVRLYEDPAAATGYGFEWSFSDTATTRTGEEITHVWFTPGAKTLTLTATRLGQTASATRSLHVSGSGGFSARVNFQPANVPAPFGYVPDSGAVFGDRANGYTYGWLNSANSSAGDSDFTLSSKNQLRDTYIRQSTSQVWEMAVPNGTYNVFISAGLAASDGSVTTNNLLTVEGLTVVDKSMTQNNFTDGSRRVTVSDGRLTLASGRDSAAVNYIEITRIDGQLSAPLARLTASTLAGFAPVAVTFDASASYANAGPIVSYAWDFGNGATATGPVASHSFQTPGLFVVTLTVTDSTGATASASTGIHVTRRVVAGSTFTSWLAAYPGVGAQAAFGDDPDRDGLPNGLEYALRTDPSTHSVPPITAGMVAGPRLALSFPRNPDATDIGLVVQASSDLSAWTDIARSQGGSPMTTVHAGATATESGTAPLIQVEVIDIEPLPDVTAPNRFLRLRVIQD